MTEAPEQCAVDISGARILLVCEASVERQLLTQLLLHLGVETRTAETSNDGFDLPGRLEQDVIVVDTGSNAGRTALAEIAARPEVTPILAIVSAAAGDLPPGASAMLERPIMDVDRLARAVASLLPTRDLAPRLAEIIDLAGADHAKELVGQLVADLESTRTALKAAVNSGDFGGIRRQTHILIALTGTLGSVGLQKTSEALNAAAHRSDLTQTRSLGEDMVSGLVDLLSEIHTRMDALTRRD